MFGTLLLIISLLGKTAAQQTFDPMERPLFEVGTPLLQPSSRPLLVMDQHLMDSSGLPIKPILLNPLPFPSFSPPLPPQSPLQPPPRPPPQIVAQQIVPQQMALDRNAPLPRQPSQSDNSPRVPFHIEFPRQPQPSNSPVRTVLTSNSLGILNQDRIHVEGFQPIDRRFASTKRRRSPVIIGDLISGKGAREEEFLPVESSDRQLSAVELFDQSDSEVANDVGSDGSGGDFQNLSRFDYVSSKNLRPESGYQVSATRLSNGLLKFRNTSNIISRVQQEAAEEESNSVLDQEEGSGFGEAIDVSNNENVIEAPLPRSFHTPVEVSEENKRVAPVEFGTTETALVSNSSTVPSNIMTVSTVDETSTVELPSTRAEGGFFAPTASPNSVPFVRDSKMLRIVKEYAGLIVGCILGIPAIVVLCYFLYLKRLKRYTGTLDVSPRQRTCHHQKSESRKTICSEENELAGSPSTSTSKTPQPPPFPHCKKYVP